MKDSLFFKQKKPLTVVILRGLLLFIMVSVLFSDTAPLNQKVILVLLSLLVLGYSISLEVDKGFVVYKHIKFLGFTVFKSKLTVAFPDYLIVFSAKYKQGAEWGSVAALGKQRGGDSFVIRCFAGNKHFTFYRTNSLELAKERCMELSNFLGIEIRGKE